MLNPGCVDSNKYDMKQVWLEEAHFGIPTTVTFIDLYDSNIDAPTYIHQKSVFDIRSVSNLLS